MVPATGALWPVPLSAAASVRIGPREADATSGTGSRVRVDWVAEFVARSLGADVPIASATGPTATGIA